MSFRAPMPAAQYQDCLNAAQKDHAKQAQCKPDETLWERTFVDPVAYYTAWLTIFTAHDARGPNKGSQRTGYFLREFNASTGLFDDPRIGEGIDWEWNMTQ